MLNFQNIHLSFIKTVQYYLSAIFWGVVTPGRFGEFIRIKYLTDQKISVGRASISVLADRVIDIGVLILMALLSFTFVFNNIESLVYTVAVALLICFIVFCLRTVLINKFEDFMVALIPNRFSVSVADFIRQCKTDINKFSCQKIFFLILFSIGIWIVYTFPFLLLGRWISLDVTVLELITGIFCGTLIGLLPISIGGVGTRDVFFIYYFGRMGVPSEKSILLSFVFIYMHLFSLAVGFIFMMYEEDDKSAD